MKTGHKRWLQVEMPLILEDEPNKRHRTLAVEWSGSPLDPTYCEVHQVKEGRANIEDILSYLDRHKIFNEVLKARQRLSVEQIADDFRLLGEYKKNTMEGAA